MHHIQMNKPTLKRTILMNSYPLHLALKSKVKDSISPNSASREVNSNTMSMTTTTANLPIMVQTPKTGIHPKWEASQLPHNYKRLHQPVIHILKTRVTIPTLTGELTSFEKSEISNDSS
jgi:hypothetical protein